MLGRNTQGSRIQVVPAGDPAGMACPSEGGQRLLGEGPIFADAESGEAACDGCCGMPCGAAPPDLLGGPIGPGLVCTGVSGWGEAFWLATDPRLCGAPESSP